ncbi:tear acid lipase-like protein [Apodemus sylvaticus]|uniref:tear acid lipase-like protein n=1 Tax=Apodemus sylvaticus TaxID=10129 RepID=UPI00224297FF|nr:tear acid lipase-like protein [Apodemus sylvaticus]
MWWLLRTMCFVHTIGNVFCFLEAKPKNPETDMNVSEIISHWGYEREEHEVLTKDGYLLLIFRIPRGRNERKESSNTTKPVVYLQHGFTVSADYWVLNPPSNCPAFLLADAGFDVWLGNSRGSNNGRKHVRLDPNSKEFWDFSFDEQIEYDIPATIDFILNKTRQTQLYYVGHSQGAYIAYGAFATNPQLAQKIKMNFALGPVVLTKYLRGVLRTVAYIDPKVIKTLFGEKDIFSRSNDNAILQFLCHREKIATACNNLLTVIFGYNPKNLNESRLDVYIGHIPAGTSIQSILHFSQGIRSGLFQKYDWGSESLNMQHYNQSTPPIYKIENMKVRTAIWSGGQDLLGDPIDTENLAAKTPNLVYHKKIPDYDHLGFILGKDVAIQVYKNVIEFINKDQSE